MIVPRPETTRLAGLLGEARASRYHLWKAASEIAGKEFQSFQAAEDWADDWLNGQDYARISAEELPAARKDRGLSEV